MDLAAAKADAGSLTTSDLFSPFNAVAFGNFTSTPDGQARMVVGGNLTGGATFDLDPARAAASSYSALTVYGNATSGGRLNINNAGGVTVQR